MKRLLLLAILCLGATPYEYDAKTAASYIDALHGKIHPFYAKRALPELDEKGDASSPWNDRTAYAVLFIVIEKDGKLADVNMVKGTGVPELNQAIKKSIEDAAPFPAPPAGIRSPDGKTRIRWQFQRDPAQECKPTHAWPMITEPG